MDPTKWASFWAFMALLAFLAIVVYLKVPQKIIAALDERSRKIQAQLDDARRLRQEAETLVAEYRRRRADAQAEADAIVTQAQREAETLTAEARVRIEEYVSRRTKAVEARIAQAETQAVAEVRSRAVDVATAAAARILAEKAQGPAGDELVARSIGTVRSSLN